MFSGIVSDIGQVRAVVSGGDIRYEIETAYDTDAIRHGASISCSGVCLSVIDKGPAWFAIEASRKTLSCTTLGTWEVGTKVNLEQSLSLGDCLDGHLVMGHVDDTVRVLEHQKEGDSLQLTVAVREPLMPYVAPKGAVTLDGVSLTVNEVDALQFTTNIIPHTQRVTTLDAVQTGTILNMEIDIIARYIERLSGRG